MKLRPLIIDEEIRGRIATIRDYADTQRLDGRALADIVENPSHAPGNDPRHVAYVPVGYRCVFSIEQHPVGWCHHLSVSVDTPGRLPRPEAVAMLMREFGFSEAFARLTGLVTPGPALLHGKVWIEDGRAVNVVEKETS